MISVQFPSPYFPLKDASGSTGEGFVYIGQPNFNPKIFGNRVDVDIVNQDGSFTTITPSGQPFTLTPGGLIEYLGAVVQLRLDQSDYSMTVDRKDGSQEDYFPSCVPPADADKAFVRNFSVSSASMTFDFYPATYYVNPPAMIITMHNSGSDGTKIVSTTFNQTVIPGLGSVYTDVDLVFDATMVGKTGSILVLGF
jgi:hypothetical protein